MRKRILLLTLAAVGSAAGLAIAGELRAARPQGGGAGGGGDADENAVRATAPAFEKAFNAGNAKAVAALWTPDGEYVDEDGKTIKGREAIEQEYAAFFKEHPKAKIEVRIVAVRVVGPEVALEEGTTRLSEPPVGEESTSHYTVVHVKRDGKWQMASVRDLESAALTSYASLKELEALIGNWTARAEETRIEAHCEWMENRNFIRRTFTVRRGEAVVASGLQMIGVDPTTGDLTSWEFSADGGLGQGVWSKDGDRWVIEANGVTRGGQAFSATNMLTFENKDTFTWQSTDRSVDGVPLRDVPVVKVTRKK